MNTVTTNFSALDSLRKGVARLAELEVKVGILKSKAARKASTDSSGIDNPTLGAIHEFGSMSRHIPARSWLRMPLGTRFKSAMQKTGSDRWIENLAENGAQHTAALVGVEAEGVIQDAFATGGWGAWPKWSKSYLAFRMRRDRARSKRIGPLLPGSLLIDSAQMRHSVSSVVQEKP